MGYRLTEEVPRNVLAYVAANGLNTIYVVSSSSRLVSFCNNVVPEITFRSLSLDDKEIPEIGDDLAEILRNKARLGYNKSGRPTLAGSYLISISKPSNSKMGKDFFSLNGTNSLQQTKDFFDFLRNCNLPPAVDFSFSLAYCKSDEEPKNLDDIISGCITNGTLKNIFTGVETPYHQDFRRKLLSFLEIPY